MKELDDKESEMTEEHGALLEVVSRLEQAWNNGDSVAWSAQFAGDADFIHILGESFHGSRDIEHGHRAIFDTIYKGSHHRFQVEKMRFLQPEVAVVFIRANLRWYPNGKEQNVEARPTLVVEKNPAGEWKIAVFQNTMINTAAVPTLADALTLRREP
jgi:uncharacterized protein (TIGR02246 family)